MEKIKVGVLGATGAVGQRFVERQGVPAHNARVNGPALGAFVLGKVQDHLGPRA